MIRYIDPSTSTDRFLSIIRNETKPLVLVDFYADWCEPCKWLDEILLKLTEKFPEEIAIFKADIEKNEVLGRDYNIKSVPVMVLFDKGNVVWRMNGFLAQQEMEELLNSFLKKSTSTRKI